MTLQNRILLSPYEYKYKIGKETALAAPDGWVEIGVKRIYNTEKNIYILYNPNTEEMKYKRKDTLNSEIWVFDWNGNPIKNIKVNHKLICFCVDEEKHQIYCIANTPEPSIGILSI